MLRQAIADTDWETLDRHGGIDAVVERVLQVEEQSASTDGPGMIDDFRLWGSLRCRQMGVPLSEGGVTLKGDMIVTPTTPFPQRAEPSPLWWGTFAKRRTGRRTTRISGVRYGKAKRGCASRVPILPGANGAPHGRDAGGESDPLVFGAGAPREEGKVDRPLATLSHPSAGVRSHHRDPWREGH